VGVFRTQGMKDLPVRLGPGHPESGEADRQIEPFFRGGGDQAEFLCGVRGRGIGRRRRWTWHEGDANDDEHCRDQADRQTRLHTFALLESMNGSVRFPGAWLGPETNDDDCPPSPEPAALGWFPALTEGQPGCVWANAGFGGSR